MNLKLKREKQKGDREEIGQKKNGGMKQIKYRYKQEKIRNKIMVHICMNCGKDILKREISFFFAVGVTSANSL